MGKREMLERAAKAAGIDLFCWDTERQGFKNEGGKHTRWNPLTDDGDALRLAVKLGFTVAIDVDDPDDACTRILNSFGGVLLRHMHHDGGAEAATRLAITRAAASLTPAPAQGENHG
ncbi:hypothetical protein [Variovorax sp. DAIF25]|uniref:hypothetical protein n=1 Tax=Variovorax sp. DAIF25 TaxID=3080983 RepID=UPI003D6C1119